MMMLMVVTPETSQRLYAVLGAFRAGLDRRLMWSTALGTGPEQSESTNQSHDVH